MNKTFMVWGGIGLAIVLSIAGLVGGNQSVQSVKFDDSQLADIVASLQRLGGTTNYNDLVVDTITVSGTSTNTGGQRVTNNTKEIFGYSTFSATNTCAVRPPLNGTSTLLWAKANVTTANGLALSIDFGTSSNAFATSTQTGMFARAQSVGAGGAPQFMFVPSGGSGMYAQNDWLVLRAATTGPVTWAGTCSGLWLQ